MKQFSYTMTDPLGLHARPAGMLAREAQKYQSVCTLTKGEKSARLTQLMALMSMGVRQGDTVMLSADGPDEDQALEGMKAFFTSHL